VLCEKRAPVALTRRDTWPALIGLGWNPAARPGDTVAVGLCAQQAELVGQTTTTRTARWKQIAPADEHGRKSNDVVESRAARRRGCQSTAGPASQLPANTRLACQLGVARSRARFIGFAEQRWRRRRTARALFVATSGRPGLAGRRRRRVSKSSGARHLQLIILARRRPSAPKPSAGPLLNWARRFHIVGIRIASEHSIAAARARRKGANASRSQLGARDL
jgi:hypothetical protein